MVKKSIRKQSCENSKKLLATRPAANLIRYKLVMFEEGGFLVDV